jgi:hypothetical protein
MRRPKILTFLTYLRGGATAYPAEAGAHSPRQSLIGFVKDGSMRSPGKWLAAFDRVPAFYPPLVIAHEVMK